MCDNHAICFAYAHTEVDPCPSVSKYLEITFTCEQKGQLIFFFYFERFPKMPEWSNAPVFGCSQCVCMVWVLRMETSQTPSSPLLPPLVSSLQTKPVCMESLAGCHQEPVCAAAEATRMKCNNFVCDEKCHFQLWHLPATLSWIQADLGQTRKVTGIIIQGCPGNDHWLTKFRLQHSMDGTTWTDYTADGQVSTVTRVHLMLAVKVDNNVSFWVFIVSSCSQVQPTGTLQTPSCWVHPCQPSTSASSRWSFTVKQAFASMY